MAQSFTPDERQEVGISDSLVRVSVGLGMGYQLVDVTLRSGECLSKLPVFNGEYLDIPDSVAFEAPAIELVELHR